MNNKKNNRRKSRRKKHKKLTKETALIPVPFHTKWVLWCHLKTERNWDISTFIKVYTISTVQDFWGVYNNIKFDDQIFFLMREGISPIWNTPKNKDGGKWNIYVNRKKVSEIWRDLSLLAVGETLKRKGRPINGIAIRPKFAQSIIKIMTSKKENKNHWYREYNQSELNKVFSKDTQFRFESHIDTVKRIG